MRHVLLSHMNPPIKYTDLNGSVIRRMVSDAEQGVGVARVEEATTPVAPLVPQLRNGLPYGEFEVLSAMFGLSDEAMAAALDISRATLHRRKKAGNLSKEESDRIVRFARVFGMALRLFGAEPRTRGWFLAPAIALGDETPLEYLDTETGARIVENLLGQIAHGVFV